MENSINDFRNYLNSISDEKLDKMISEIESEGFCGPTVDEYFQNLKDDLGRLFDGPDETIASIYVHAFYQDSRVVKTLGQETAFGELAFDTTMKSWKWDESYCYSDEIYSFAA